MFIFRKSKYNVKRYHFIHCTDMKFSIKDFFSKCDQIRRKLRIWSHLLKKSLNPHLPKKFVLFASLKAL